MKKIFKSIVLTILCAFIAITSISTGSRTTYAAKKIPLKITFNGKSVNLVDDMCDSEKSQKIKVLEQNWGKPKKRNQSSQQTYVWKKGKTFIEVSKSVTDGENVVGFFNVSIKDKNGSALGIKIGMKKSTALKKLRKIFGKNNVTICFDGQQIKFDDDGKWTVEGKPKGDDEIIRIYNVYGWNGFVLTDGRVSLISFNVI